MARVSWFSEESDELMFGQYAKRMESWQQATTDGVITAEDVKEQANRVTALLKDVEGGLDDEQHEKVGKALMEWAVLQGLSTTLLMQESQNVTPTSEASSATAVDTAATSAA